MSSIRSIFSSLANALQNRVESEQPTLPQIPTNMPLNSAAAEAAISSMLERMAQTNAIAPSRAQTAEKPASTPAAEVKPMYEGVKTTAELNQKLLDTIKNLSTQPTGMKPVVNKKTSKTIKPGGVDVSEQAAKLHISSMEKKGLKARFETVGQKYSVPPALLAAIASRESNMGNALHQKDDVFFGWGDKSKRKGEAKKQWHGFGIMQVDKNTGELPESKAELLNAYGKQKLDPYSEHHIDQATQIFLTKLEKVKQQFPKLSPEEQIATAVSRYNGGDTSQFFPKSDHRTTGRDYANDTLVRARHFAKEWDKLK